MSKWLGEDQNFHRGKFSFKFIKIHRGILTEDTGIFTEELLGEDFGSPRRVSPSRLDRVYRLGGRMNEIYNQEEYYQGPEIRHLN